MKKTAANVTLRVRIAVGIHPLSAWRRKAASNVASPKSAAKPIIKSSGDLWWTPIPGGASDRAVVVTVTVTEAGVAAVGFAVTGERAQVASEAATEQVSVTDCAKPLTELRLNEYVAVPPGDTIALDCEPDATPIVKSAVVVPVPERVTV